MGLLKVVGKGILRAGKIALTKEGGSLFTVTSEINKWDAVAIGAIAVRTIVGLAVVYGAFVISKQFGVPVEDVIKYFNEVAN